MRPGATAPIAIGNRNETPECLVEQSINAALDDAFAEAEALLLARFGSIQKLRKATATEIAEVDGVGPRRRTVRRPGRLGSQIAICRHATAIYYI